ncbi:TetR/AcrR family transcriptional regulator [Streptomyces mobaraensis]|uniref:TetR/AcrR family transcriptional regulator n=1 Tax=Streptomyces mobaraensis TaxID=35621 RepID=UPI001F03A3E2|nr:TetR/AcrR family transcriptional regulator [Streptomyces mobaraensis]
MPENPTRPATAGDGGGSARRRGRPTGDHEARRADLLEAAASVIAREGYASTSPRQVAQRAGCTTGTVTYCFANKDELVAVVTRSRFDGFDAVLEPGRGGPASGRS